MTSGQAAAIAAFATLAGGTLAGLAGQNAAAGALAAQNEAMNNCLGYPQSCTQLLKSAASSFVTAIGGPSTFLQVMAMLSMNADIGGTAGEEEGLIEGAESSFAAEEAGIVAGSAATNSGVPSGLSGLANPGSIRFTQDSISSMFKDGTSLQDTIGALTSGVISPADLPPIRVYEQDGLVYTLDNRRLFATYQAGTQVNIIPATAQEVSSQGWKFTTPNQGCIICVKGTPKP